ncbi:MAG: two-component system sensor histidine kinase PhoQ [Gammaproteobacteria bacterium]
MVAAGVVLAVFLSAAGLALDQAFRDTALTSVQERLTGRTYRVLGVLDLADLSEQRSPAESSPDPSLATPESGYYAQVLNELNERVWNSRSMLGLTFEGPRERTVGDFLFSKTESSTGESLFVLSYTVLWEGTGAESAVYTVQVAENERAFTELVSRFRKSLWLGFVGIGVVLLLLQTAILRWGLKPLRDVALEVNRIERGEESELTGRYPLELNALTDNLNALIRTNESSVKRYRNALGDLAHSLKTPLAVLRNNVEQLSIATDSDDSLVESLDQLDSTINYQLQRAAVAGRSVLGGSFEIALVVEQIANSLRKVHADRNLQITATVEPGAKFQGDRGDMMEIVGNIADNACKWARSSVSIKVWLEANDRKPSLLALIIEIRDDGVGMPQEDVAKAMLRGSRLDQSTDGHGIGLAVVKELVEDVYNGKLIINSSSAGTVAQMRFNN